MGVLVILGSARAESHTAATVDAVLAGRSATVIDLKDVDIQHYEYNRPMDRDGFARVTKSMLANDVIVFATPVYWYAMSGRMKVLFDRFTDLVTVRKDVGRQLQGRHVVLLACGSEPLMPDGFEVPFRETAAYLKMDYRGAFYAQTNTHGLTSYAIESAPRFGDKLFERNG
jgi:multimeric flavodoxin WrbA